MITFIFEFAIHEPFTLLTTKQLKKKEVVI